MQPRWRPLPLEPLPSSARSGGLATSIRRGSVDASGGSSTGGVAAAGSGGWQLPHAALIRAPLPNCSVVFVHHLEKTGGTTVRSILQRAAQLGQYDIFSFVNRFNKLQMQMIYHKLWHAMRAPGGLTNLRLAVEIHIGGHLNHPYFLKYTLPDLLHLRQQLRANGCKCNLVTLLRHPLLQHLSWHYHFVNHRVPLCFWSNPPDCQVCRLALPADKPEREGSYTHSGTERSSGVGVAEGSDARRLKLTPLASCAAGIHRFVLFWEFFPIFRSILTGF
jgi:hypothetical protein